MNFDKIVALIPDVSIVSRNITIAVSNTTNSDTAIAVIFTNKLLSHFI